MIYLSSALGVIASVAGLYFSFTYNLASGATIVLVSTVLFLLAFAFSPKQGVLWRSIKTKRKKLSLS
jgi:manganese transport system permease protein